MLSDLWSRLITWTGTIVSPDWAALVALIPVLLLLVVLAFLVITAAKWAGAGPTRRGRGRKSPVGPDGRPMPSPSGAPFVVAVGAFVLAFGLVAGGPWLIAGIVIALAGLAWLTIEVGRGRQSPPSVPEADAETADGSPGDAPPSQRAASRAALALGWALLLLGVGLVVGGIVLGLGIVAVVVAGAAWGRSLFAEPQPPAIAPAAPARPLLAPVRVIAVVVVALAVVGVAATSKVVPDAPAPGATASPSASDAAAASLPPADAALEARDIAYVQTTLSGPAGRPFTVAFDNRDKVPHNLEIRDAAGKSVFTGDIVTGPTVVVYEVPALPAGQYPFVCTVHPGMTGTLTVK